jgi:hypothetical protein
MVDMELYHTPHLLQRVVDIRESENEILNDYSIIKN